MRLEVALRRGAGLSAAILSPNLSLATTKPLVRTWQRAAARLAAADLQIEIENQDCHFSSQLLSSTQPQYCAELQQIFSFNKALFLNIDIESVECVTKCNIVTLSIYEAVLSPK